MQSLINQDASSDLNSASDTDKWVKTFNEYNRNLKKVENISLNSLPYGVLKSISATIQNNWSAWKKPAETLSGKDLSKAEDFLSDLTTLASKAKLVNLINLSKKIDSFAISKCLTDCKNLEKLRQQADQDFSKGFIDDIDEETIVELAITMVKDSIDWRLFGDGLGFSLYNCHWFKDPKEIIKKWVNENPKASVCRLYFEAKQIGMHSVCNFLDAIPLEPVEKINPAPDRLDLIHRKVTKFDLQRLGELIEANGIQMDWKKFAEETIGSSVKKNSFMAPADILWQEYNLQLSKLISAFGDSKHPVLAKFDRELRSGLFEPKSPGGITLSQICYLVKQTVALYIPRGIQSMRGPIDISLLRKKHLPEINLSSPLNFDGFLILYWQQPANEKMNLNEFCNNIIHLLKTTQNEYGQNACSDESFIMAFEQAYHEIKPWRSFDPLLLEANTKKEKAIASKPVSEDVKNNNSADEVAKQVSDVAKPVIKKGNDNSCGICMDRKVNAVILPCAHLGYCLECIKNITKCPACTTEITQKIRVFNLNE